MPEDAQTALNESGVAETTAFGFLLLPDYTMISLASALEPLRMANQLAGRELYQWLLITADGKPVQASDGIVNLPDAAMTDDLQLDTLIVAGGLNITENYTEQHLRWLRRLEQRNVRLGGICTGTFVLARAGVMSGRDCSVHWESMATLQELHPDVTCNSNLFTVEQDRVTSSGGTAPLDMVINLISREHGPTLATAISEMFVLDRVRGQTDKQGLPLHHSRGVLPGKLIEASDLMQANIEEPIALEELASLLSVSRRQLERLFNKYLDCSPSRYYLRLRLGRARQLLKQTSLPIIEIASICGFVSMPHFSKCYRTHLGLTPKEERLGLVADAQKGGAEVEDSTAAQRDSSQGNLNVSESES